MFYSKLNIDAWEKFSREVSAVIDKETSTQTATPPAPIPSDPHSDAYAEWLATRSISLACLPTNS
jgi:hypothetical protein